MRRSNDAALRALGLNSQSLWLARAGQRAWLAPVAVKCAEVEGNKELVVQVTIRNSGTTFARKVNSTGRVIASEPGANFSCADIDRAALSAVPSVMLLAPNAEQNSWLHHRPGLTTETINDIMNGKQNVGVCGKVTYDDIFGCPHWTKYCFMLNEHLEFQGCAADNEVDTEQCP
jgi:hypothetical protein